MSEMNKKPLTFRTQLTAFKGFIDEISRLRQCLIELGASEEQIYGNIQDGQYISDQITDYCDIINYQQECCRKSTSNSSENKPSDNHRVDIDPNLLYLNKLEDTVTALFNYQKVFKNHGKDVDLYSYNSGEIILVLVTQSGSTLYKIETLKRLVRIIRVEFLGKLYDIGNIIKEIKNIII